MTGTASVKLFPNEIGNVIVTGVLVSLESRSRYLASVRRNRSVI